MQKASKYTLYVGTNNPVTHTQTVPTKEMKTQVDAICETQVEGFTVFALTLALLTLLSLLAGCNTGTKHSATEASQMNNTAYTIGVPSGATAVNAVESALSKAKIKYYNSLPDAYHAVQQGKVDALAFDRYLLGFAVANGLTGVKVLSGDVGANDDVAIGISRNSGIPDLQQKINDCLSELRADGILDDMFER